MTALKACCIAMLCLLGVASANAQSGRGENQSAANVFVEPVQSIEFYNNIEALGTLEPKERVDLTLNTADRVTSLYFEDGQRVSKGKTLLSLAQAEQIALVEAAEASEDEAIKQLNRAVQLANEDAVSQSQLDQARRNANAAKAQKAAVLSRLKDRVLVAPFDGVLGFRRVSVGSYVSAGDTIATLIDDSEMRLEFSIPSVFLRSLTLGTQIVAQTADLPAETFTGVITSIDNAINPVTRSVTVRATLPNEDRILKAGMFMTVELRANPRTALAVPEGAIEPRGPLSFVYVVDDQDGALFAKRVEVKPGLRSKGMVEIETGLEDGQMIVTEGLIRVRDGGAIKIEDKSMLSPRVQSPNGQSIVYKDENSRASGAS